MNRLVNMIPCDAVQAAVILPRLTQIVEEVILYGRGVDPEGYNSTQWPRGGGYVCFRHTRPPPGLPSNGPTFVGMVRVSAATAHPDWVAPERWAKFWQNCQEKCGRLALYYDMGHVSSFQTRDEAAQKYGGGIVVQGWAMAFSGLPEEGDEAVMLTLALDQGWIEMPGAQRIAQHGGGHFFAGFVAYLRAKHFFDRSLAA